MMEKENLKYYAPFVFFLLMLLDGQMTRALEEFSKDIFFLHSHMLMLALVLASFQLTRRYMLTSAVIIGVLMDSYYIGIIGIYALCLPLIVLLCYQIFTYVRPNGFTLLLSVILFVTFLETTLLGVHLAFSLAQVDLAVFVTRTLGPTLILNVALFLVLVFPFKKLLGYQEKPKKKAN